MIFRAAMQLLLQEGEQAASMKRIGEVAGCGMGTMYNYFSSKEALINDLYQNIYARKKSFLSENMLPQGSVKKRFIAYWMAQLNFAIQYSQEQSFLSIYANSPIILKETHSENVEIEQWHKEILMEGQTQEIVKEINTDALSLFVSGALSTIPPKEPPSSQWVEQMVNMAWDAIKS